MDANEKMQEVVAFLLGEGALDGVWYGTALRTHENGGQDSEAVTVAKVMGDRLLFINGSYETLPEGTLLYASPPSALIHQDGFTVTDWCSSLKVESLLAENRKQVLLDAADDLSDAEYNASHSGKQINHVDELRRMAEGEKE